MCAISPARLLALGFVLMIIGVFAAKNVSVLLHEYRRAAVDAPKHEAMLIVCKGHAVTSWSIADKCREHEELAGANLFLLAIQNTLAKTDSCGNMACIDVVPYVINKLGGTILLVIVGLGGAFAVYNVFRVVVAPFAVAATRYVDQDESYSRRLESARVESVDYDDSEDYGVRQTARGPRIRLVNSGSQRLIDTT